MRGINAAGLTANEIAAIMLETHEEMLHYRLVERLNTYTDFLVCFGQNPKATGVATIIIDFENSLELNPLQ